MSKGNWIKVNRSMQKNFLWDFTKPLYLMAWIDILMEANYIDKKVMVDSKVMVVKRGSFITSIVKLSERWQCTRKTADRILNLLESDGMITTERTRRYTIITVENYALYQDVPTTDDPTDEPTDDPTDEPTDDPTDDPQHKKYKNNKELYKNIKNREERKETRARGGSEGAEKKDDFHNLLDENADLMQQLRKKYRKGENDAG